MNKITVLQGHVLDRLKELPDNSVHCVITSPPYWGLRDYGIEPQVWPDGWRGSYGLEPTIELYVQHTVEIFREVRRVLRKDGVCFLNVGDSYASGKGSCFNPGGGESSYKDYRKESGVLPLNRKNKSDLDRQGLKPKDLCMVPARVALALQADGWWLRSEITWIKPNPLPESVTDRPTKSTEKIYLLAKSSRYFWDAENVREGVTGNAHSKGNKLSPPREDVGIGHKDWCVTTSEIVTSRNLRDAWTVATEAFPGAHFATFPQRLVETCLKAGTSERGCCAKCGAPWVRMVEKKFIQEGPQRNRGKIKSGDLMAKSMTIGDKGFVGHNENTTLGWRHFCRCEAGEPIPCTILDPFGGAGTVGLVAGKLGRDAILIELKPEYCDMAAKRLRGELGMLAKVEVR